MNPYTHQIFFVVRKSRKQDFIEFIRNHSDLAAKLGFDSIIESERVKICSVPPPNHTNNVVVLGTASYITKEQRDWWVSIKDRVPTNWQDDVSGTIHRNDRADKPTFDSWLESVGLYRQVEPNEN